MYMAMKHLAQISQNLLDAGRRADEPVAIVCNGTLTNQQVLETTLGRAAEDAAKATLEPPAIVCVGEVVRLRAGLDWLGAAQGRSLDPDPLNLRRTSETG